MQRERPCGAWVATCTSRPWRCGGMLGHVRRAGAARASACGSGRRDPRGPCGELVATCASAWTPGHSEGSARRRHVGLVLFASPRVLEARAGRAGPAWCRTCGEGNNPQGGCASRLFVLSLYAARACAPTYVAWIAVLESSTATGTATIRLASDMRLVATSAGTRNRSVAAMASASANARARMTLPANAHAPR